MSFRALMVVRRHSSIETSPSVTGDATAAIDGTGLRVGTVIDGKYRVDRILGRGGMGVVLAATHLHLGQQVAIKILLATVGQSEVNVARFEREARAVAKLRSEHVARVFDVGRLEDGARYMVMELLAGSDLEDDIEQNGAVPSSVAASYVLQACEALAEAHAHGIVHRDLKPQNLFLSRRASGGPIVKVLDFGISKVPTEGEHSLTGTNDVSGTPRYMAPEQMRGMRDVDARTDVWSLGAILYWLVSARVAFDGATLAELCSRVILSDPEPLQNLRSDLPPDFVAVVERCLRKDPTQRFRNVEELASALVRFTADDATVDVFRPSARPITPRRHPAPEARLAGTTSPPLSGTIPNRPSASSWWRPALAMSAFALAGAVVAWAVNGRPIRSVATDPPLAPSSVAPLAAQTTAVTARPASPSVAPIEDVASDAGAASRSSAGVAAPGKVPSPASKASRPATGKPTVPAAKNPLELDFQ